MKIHGKIKELKLLRKMTLILWVFMLSFLKRIDAASVVEIIYCYTPADCPHINTYCDEGVNLCMDCMYLSWCAAQYYPQQYDTCHY